MSFVHSLLLFLHTQIFIHHINALFNCSSVNPCVTETKSCSADSDECTLHCGGQSSCDGVTFYCNIGQNKQCKMICAADNSCENAQIQVGSSTQLSLECTGTNSCTQMHIVSTATTNTIVCNGVRSCDTLSVAMSGFSYIECGDYTESCESLIYTAFASPNSLLNCLGSSTACSNVIFNCTTTAMDCSVTCESSESCDGSQLLCNGKNAEACTSDDLNGFITIGGEQIPTDAPTAAPTAPPIYQHYVLIEDAMDWFSAQNYCESVYETDLATITNSISFDDINIYFNTSNNPWIGLNNYYQDMWQWIDGSSCDYIGNETEMCEDDEHWADNYPWDENATCAIMTQQHNGMYTNVDCMDEHSFLCQLTKRVEYICAQNEALITKRVFQYENDNLYVSDRTMQNAGRLTLSLSNDYWYFSMGNHTLSQCIINATGFILPTECLYWEWVSNSTDFTELINVPFADCDFSGICFTDSDGDYSNFYTVLTRHYEFEYFDMLENGAVYYSPGGTLYLYPVTYNDSVDSRKYIASYSIHTKPQLNSSIVFAYCNIQQSEDTDYVFNITHCDEGWIAQGEASGRNMQISTMDCAPTPFPTAAPTIASEVYFMRFYCYYDSNQDALNLNESVAAFRNVTLTAFFDIFNSENANDAYIMDFEICDIFVDYSDPQNIVSTLNAPNCPSVVSDIAQAQYYAVANFKISAHPVDILSFGDSIISTFQSDDFIVQFNLVLDIMELRGIFMVAEEHHIYVLHLNDTRITTTTNAPTPTPLNSEHLILKYIYDLDNFQAWKDTKYQLFAEYLENATMTTFYDIFTSNDGELSNFDICAVFDDQLVNVVNDTDDTDCLYDIGTSADEGEFSAFAPFEIQYSSLSAFKSSIISIFEGTTFLSELTENMNTLMSLSTSRRLLSTDFTAINIDVIDPTEPDETLSPSTTIAMSTLDEDSTDIMISGDSYNDELFDSLFQYAFIGIISLFLLIIVLSYCVSQFIWINHFFRISAIVTVAIQLMDMLSDVFFTAHASFGRESSDIMIIFILSACFIGIPIITTLIQLWHHMNKHWLKDDKLRSWLGDNTKLLYFVSIVTGSSFIAIELFNSNLFSLSQFDMGLTRTQLMGYQYKRVYSIVLLENIPQLMLQAWYIYAIGGKLDIITATSMTFTIISIVVAIISMFVQKQILFNQDLVTISFDVTGACVVAQGYRCRNVVRSLHDQLSTVLGLDKGLLEIVRPYNIPNGVKVQVNVHIVDKNDSNMDNRDLCEQFKNRMVARIESEDLHSMLMNCWQLDSAPKISNLSLSIIDSKQKRRISEKNSEVVTQLVHSHYEGRGGDSVQPGAYDPNALDNSDASSDDGVIAAVNTMGNDGEDDDVVAAVNTFAGDDDEDIVASVNTLLGEVHH